MLWCVNVNASDTNSQSLGFLLQHLLNVFWVGFTLRVPRFRVEPYISRNLYPEHVSWKSGETVFFSQVWKRNFIIFQITLLREYLLGNKKLAGKRTQAPDLGNDSVVFSKLQWDRSGPRMLFYVYCEVSFALLLFLCKPAQQQKEKKKKKDNYEKPLTKLFWKEQQIFCSCQTEVMLCIANGMFRECSLISDISKDRTGPAWGHRCCTCRSLCKQKGI